MGNPFTAELLKIRKRWIPYLLFLLMIAGAAFMIWTGYGSSKGNEDFAARQADLRTFLFPYSIAALLDSGQFWASAIFVGILTSSSVATEFGWGTVRQVLILGQSRSRYLMVKLAALTFVCTASLLTVLAIGLLFSVLATEIDGKPVTLDVPGGPSIPEIALMIARTAMGILPYGLLAFFLTVLARSTALGVAGTMGYMLVESIVVAILLSLEGVWADLGSVFIGHNVAALMAENHIGRAEYNSIAPREAFNTDLPDPWLAALIVVAYCAALLAASFVVFWRRDVTVASGN